MIKKPILFYLSFVAASLLALCSASFSVYGLSSLFAGARFFIIIAFSALEFAKIVALSVFYNYRKNFQKKLRVYYIFSIITLIFITSIGVYGFLSNAYQKNSDKINIQFINENFNEEKQKIIKDRIDIYNNQLNDYRKRLLILNEQRKTQEERLNRAQETVNKKMIDSARKDIERSDAEIKDLNIKIENVIKLINEENKKLEELKKEKIDTSEKNKGIDVGPLKFLSKILSSNMDSIVNWLILLLVVVFDPLAIVLWIATNQIVITKKEEIKKEDMEEIKTIDDFKGFMKKFYESWKKTKEIETKNEGKKE